MLGESLRVIPLGGLGEIGRNMLVLEYKERLLIIDAGLMFPQNDMFGIDLVIPDFSYVAARADQVLGIILTHGHEDHIGGLPYLLQHVQAPIYGTRLTCALAEAKLGNNGLAAPQLRIVESGGHLSLAPFEIDFFHVSHSIPDGVGLAIETPVGLVVHSGDFKFDYSPVDGLRSDFSKLAELGGRNVLLLLSDSTNSEKPGYTPSEEMLGDTLARLIGNAKGRVIVATFASNISRVQQVIDTSRQFGRRVAIVGRSMVQNVRTARDLGYLEVPDDVLLPINRVTQLPDEEITLVCTGSQGEPTSALVRMGKGTNRSISVMPGDTVIVSASPIPGNEEYVNRTLDDLFRLGAQVFYDQVFDVHVSGHASQEEQKLMLSLIRPEYFVPIHGEYRHLVWHGALARQCGVAPDKVLIIETGDVLSISPFGAEVIDHVTDGQIVVDGQAVNDASQKVMQDRRLLAQSGFLVVSVNLDKYTGGLVGQPEIATRGFIYESESDFVALARDQIVQALKWGGSRSELTERVRVNVERFAFQETGRRPIVMTMVNRV